MIWYDYFNVCSQKWICSEETVPGKKPWSQSGGRKGKSRVELGVKQRCMLELSICRICVCSRHQAYSCIIRTHMLPQQQKPCTNSKTANTAHLEGSSCHYPELQWGICNSVGSHQQTDWTSDRCSWPTHTWLPVCLIQNVISVWRNTHYLLLNQTIQCSWQARWTVLGVMPHFAESRSAESHFAES